MIGFENPAVLVLLLALLPLTYLGYKSSRFGKALVFTKILTVGLLITAAASPFIDAEQQIDRGEEIKILEDNSRSAELIEERPEFEEIETDSRTIASGNSSDLKSGMLRNMEENSSFLVVSDLQSDESLEEVVDTAREKNTSLNIYRPEFREASSVSISGPETTVPGAENRFTVEVSSTGEEPEPELTVDEETVDLEQESDNIYSFERSFEQEGSYEIMAEIESEGELPETNEFYKTVKVTEKPNILILGEQGALNDHLSDFYELEYRDEVPDDLSDYYTVISKQPFDDEQLSDYVIEGNGLIHTGEMDTESNLLPVRPSEEPDDTDGTEIMLVIDVSVTAEEFISEQQRVAYSLADTLPYNNEVGAIAYNQDPYLLSEPKPLANHREELKSQISSLETGGNTLHHGGLEAAYEHLEDDGNIILVSDGRITALGENVNTRQKSLDLAREEESRVLTVGVDLRNERFLQDLAEAGGGTYLDADQSGRLNFMFEAGEADGEAGRIVKVNNHHFITEGLERLSTETAGYEQVEPKPGSNLLVTSDTGQPFLTGWRYGVGRVAAFSGGSEDLSSVSQTDPELISRTVSWAVGNPERKQDERLTVKDGREGDKVSVESTYEIDELSRQGEDLYGTELEVEDTGFHSFQGEPFGYSYNEEVESIGYNEENEFLASETGGQVFSPDQKEEIKESVASSRDEEGDDQKSLSEYFIAAALIFFLAEVGYRKRRGKK